MKRFVTTYAIAGCILLALPGKAADARAGEGDGAPASGRNDALQVSPYLWAAGIEGAISPFRSGPAMNVDKSFADILKDLNIGIFVNVWGRRGRFVYSADVMYVDTTDANGSGPLPAFQIPGLGVSIPPGAAVGAKVDTKEFMATLQGGYRVVDSEDLRLDVLGGARFWYISNDVAVTAAHPAIGTQTASHGEHFNWVDPVVGMRAFLPLTEKLSLQAQGDVGGFGASSQFTWSVLATFNYILSDRFSVSAGYKVLDVDYDRGGRLFDMRLSGPALGMTYRF